MDKRGPPKFFRKSAEDIEKQLKFIAKNPTELARLRLERLTKNIDKPAPIPNPKREWKPAPPPEFVRNVVGASAAAGSAEYHIYRNQRQKEILRQNYLEQQAKKEVVKQEFEERRTQKQEEMEQKTAKKRAKRLKKKEKMKQHKKQKLADKTTADGDESPTSEASDSADADDNSNLPESRNETETTDSLKSEVEISPKKV